MHFITTFATACVFFTGLAHGRDQQTELAKAANELTKILVDQKHKSVSFGTIQSKSAAGNIGPGLLIDLRNEFQRINAERKSKDLKFIEVVDKSRNRIQGEYSVDDDPDDINTEESKRFLALKVKIQIVRDSDVTHTHTFYSSRVRDIIPGGGVSSNFQGIEDARETHATIRQAIEDSRKGKPTFIKIGTRIKSSKQSQQEVEILTANPQEKDVYTPAKITDVVKGSPLVPVSIGRLYAVKIYNHADHEVAVKLKIDGIDQFTFSKDRVEKTGKPRFSSWIIGPKSSFAIKGWHLTANPKTKNNLSSFIVNRYGDGISQFTPVDMKQNGVIAVSFSRAHRPGAGTAKGNAETGFGPPVEQKQTVVKRKIDPEHDYISVRYTR